MILDGARQENVDAVWSEVWSGTPRATASVVFSNRLFIEGYKKILPIIPPSAALMLETGTGSGRYAAAVARDLPFLRVIATDILSESLESVRALQKELALKNLEAEIANVERLPYPDESFDVVLSDALIQHVPHEEKAVSEMVRVLKPGGVLIISGVNLWNFHGLVRLIQRIFGHSYEYGMERLYTHARLRELVTSFGGRVIDRTGFFPAYGLYRLKRLWAGFGFLARILNRITRVLDTVMGDAISRQFGFEIVVVATKSTVAGQETR